MNSQIIIPSEIVTFCHKCSEGLSGMNENGERIDFMRNLLPELLRDRPLFRKILHDIVEKGAYPDLRYATMFDSEFILFTHPEHLFSLRMFIWTPGNYDPVHDHNSWGVIGPVTGKLEVINYKRGDDGSREGHARLIETDRRMVHPGDTYFVVPFNEGIHKTGNPTSRTIIQVSIYGEGQIQRNHINGFDLEMNRVYPIYAPKIKKKLLAKQALTDLNTEMNR
jgi:predicted metal-dependent enzyme (double-stranded beta helix superfamily)